MGNRFDRKILIGILSGFFAGFLVWCLHNANVPGDFPRQIESIIFQRLQNMPAREASELVVVTIDQTTLNELGAIDCWPDSFWTEAFEKLRTGNAYLIGINLILDEKKHFPTEVSHFVQTARQSANIINTIVVTPTNQLPTGSHFDETTGLVSQRFRLNIPEENLNTLPTYHYLAPRPADYLNAGIGIGAVSLTTERQNSLWRVPLILRLNHQVYPGFATALVGAFLQADSITWRDNQVVMPTRSGQHFSFPVDNAGRMLISRRIFRERFARVSLSSLITELNDPAELQKLFHNKVVLIGPTPATMEEMYSPLLRAYPPDVGIQAKAFLQLINRRMIRELSDAQGFLVFLVTATIAGILLCFFRPLAGFLIGIAVTTAFIFLAGWIFATKFIWLPLFFSLFTWWLTFAVYHGTHYWIARRKHRRIEALFSSYLSPAVLKTLGDHPEELRLTGEKKECTIFRLSPGGFESALQTVTIEKWVALLNQYLSRMSRCILGNDGTIEGYQGAAIRAIFGAPARLDDHAFKACKTALEIQRVFKDFQDEWRTLGIPEIYPGIGINSGALVVGNLGSDFRFTYAAVGNPVDIVARLEEANRLYNTTVLLTEDTYQPVKERVVVRPIDRLRVRGRRGPLTAYELIALADEPLGLQTREMLTFFQQGYNYYLAKHWDWAANQFRQVLQINGHDGPARIYLLRCQEFLQDPPGQAWDGVYTLKTRQ